MTAVHIVQRILPHYRHRLFDMLYERLAREQVSLRVYYGRERPGTVPKSKSTDAPWAVAIENRYFNLGFQELVWQAYGSPAPRPDLIIVEQANRLLLNYLLLLRRRLRGGRIAYWGHGMNMQDRDPRTVRARMKRALLSSVDWWFAYTDVTKAVLLEAGFPAEAITVLQNSVDVTDLIDSMAACDDICTDAARKKAGIPPGPVGIYCGGIYPDKRVAFLLSALERIRERIPDFQLVVIGSGPDEHLVRDFASRHPGLSYLGPLFGSERAPYFKMADVMLMPGLVGLAVIDSFAARTPLITTDAPIHSPEIAYVESGSNGVIAHDSVEAYADAVVDVLRGGALDAMKDACATAARTYSLERMAENFSAGILRAMGR